MTDEQIDQHTAKLGSILSGVPKKNLTGLGKYNPTKAELAERWRMVRRKGRWRMERCGSDDETAEQNI